MKVIHEYEGTNIPFDKVLVQKRKDSVYCNIITTHPYNDGYTSSIIGVWNIRWKKLLRNINCLDQKRNWIKNKA
jgi:hypothetical protein